jgi:peroxiredoxin
LQEVYQSIKEKDYELITISMDTNIDAKNMVDSGQIRYPVLSNPSGSVIGKYNVLNLLGDGVSAPATFVIGQNREILWKYIGKSSGDRPGIAELMSKLN